MTTLPADALREAVRFQADGPPLGNLTLGWGEAVGRKVRLALVENRVASGSIGRLEAGPLAACFEASARERTALVLFLDSAGAKISEGLVALGGFRRLFRAGLDARLAGIPLVAVLGRNCFGGASMLAHLATRRLFSPVTRLAMSGPSILASAAGVEPLDEMFRAMADAAISPAARAQASGANALWSDVASLRDGLQLALAQDGDPAADLRHSHVAMAGRLPAEARMRPAESVRRRDLDALFPGGYEATDCDGFVAGIAGESKERVPFCGLLSRSPVGAGRAWRLADYAWGLTDSPPKALHVVLDCETHAARLDDERVVLSEYIVGMSTALACLARAGSKIQLTILGRAGGGVYVALAAPMADVAVEHGARVQVLPGAAVSAILGEDRSPMPEAAESVAAGVADREIRLGLIR